MKKTQTFEESKRVSEAKGFSGYKIKRSGLMQQIIDIEQGNKKYKKLTNKKLNSLVAILLANNIKEVKKILV